MAATEDISIRVALDDRQAQTALESLRNQTASMSGGVTTATSSFDSLNTKIDTVNKVAGSAATAISGVTGAVGGLSGQAGAAVGAVGNLAASFATGGPLALGIAAIGSGVAWLTSKYQESAKAAEQAAKAETEAVQKTAKEIENITRGVEGRIASALGIDDVAVKLGQLEVKVKETNQLYADMEEDKADYVRALMDMGDSFEDAEEKYQKQLNETAERVQLLASEYNNAVGAAEEYGEKIAVLNRIEARKKELDDQAIQTLTKRTKATKDNAVAAKQAADEIIAIITDEAETLRELGFEESAIQDQISGAYAQRLKEQAELDKQANEERRKRAEQAAAEQLEIERMAAEKARRIQEQRANDAASLAMTTASIIAGSSQQLIDDLIAGQEHAFERFFAGIMKQAGTVLVGKGIEAVGSGVANLVLGNPAGAAQIATGSALIGAGLGLGGIGSGVEASLIGQGGGGAAMASGAAATATPMGAGRISTGSTGQRDGGQEQTTYVFNAPVFGDQNRSARHVARLQRRAHRDLLLV